MDDADLTSIDHFATAAQGLPLEDQAGCLLTVLDSVIEVIDDPPREPIAAAIAGSDARQVFSRCSETLCRPLSRDQTRELLEMTLFGVCERLARSGMDSPDGGFEPFAVTSAW